MKRRTKDIDLEKYDGGKMFLTGSNPSQRSNKMLVSSLNEKECISRLEKAKNNLESIAKGSIGCGTKCLNGYPINSMGASFASTRVSGVCPSASPWWAWHRGGGEDQEKEEPRRERRRLKPCRQRRSFSRESHPNKLSE